MSRASTPVSRQIDDRTARWTVGASLRRFATSVTHMDPVAERLMADNAAIRSSSRHWSI